jgi:hypothetical protein
MVGEYCELRPGGDALVMTESAGCNNFRRLETMTGNERDQADR